MKKKFIILTLLAIPFLSQARVETPEEGSSIAEEPQVTIIEGKNKRIEVRQINGQVYSIKVIPNKGQPYFLVDKTGDGKFIQDSADRMQIPEWVIFSW